MIKVPILAQKYIYFLWFARVNWKSNKNGGFWHHGLFYFVGRFVGRSTAPQTSLFKLSGVFTNLWTASISWTFPCGALTREWIPSSWCKPFVLGRPNREPSLCISVTPVRYVSVAKVNPLYGMESSCRKGFRENLHALIRGSILPEKLALSIQRPSWMPQERNKRR